MPAASVSENDCSGHELIKSMSDEDIRSEMQKLYLGIQGGRKFCYQLKLAINRGIDLLADPMLG